MEENCSVDFCSNICRSGGMCSTHVAQMKKYGEVFPVGELQTQVRDEPLPKCAVSHCELEATHYSNGALCPPHYQKKYRGHDPEDYRVQASGTRLDKVCLVDDCSRKAVTKKLCKRHYEYVSIGKIPCPPGTDIALKPMCAFEGCGHRAQAYKGGSFCHSHYIMKLEGVSLRPLNGAMIRGEVECVVSGCDRLAVTRMLCPAHYARANEYGLKAGELSDLLLIEQCQNPGCTNTERLHIDHDHSTGRVRDILCSSCNTALGMLGEDAFRISGLLEYLEKHTQT